MIRILFLCIMPLFFACGRGVSSHPMSPQSPAPPDMAEADMAMGDAVDMAAASDLAPRNGDLAANPRSGTWKKLAAMPTKRQGLAAVAGPDGRIYALGGYAPSALSVVEVYTPSADSWQRVAPMPHARYQFTTLLGSDGRLYAIGGNYDDSTNPVDVYDIAHDSWSTAPALPTRRYRAAGTSRSDGTLYVIGGQDSSAVELGSFDTFTIGAPAWTGGASALLTPRSGHAVAQLADRSIFAIGGSAMTSADGSDGIDKVEVLAPGADRWTSAPPLPTPRTLLGAAVGGDGKIYAVGGTECPNGDSACVPRQYLATTEVYSPSMHAWTAVSPMPTARFDHAVVALDGLIYAIGGAGLFNTPTDAVEVYTP
jgi:N-acetylneuraminic acid mutarotase